MGEMEATFLKVANHLDKEEDLSMAEAIELVDLVDSHGEVRQRNVPRFESDRFPDLHLPIIIGVVFDKRGRILVHKRAMSKKVNPGDIDHVCGGVRSGETPEIAAAREALEETGVKPIELRVIAHGVNKYNRYRYLLVGRSFEEPSVVDPSEVEWIKFMTLEELKTKKDSGELNFVDEFFEDAAIAIREFEQSEIKFKRSLR